MWDMIHTEGPGQLGYSLAIVFYFASAAVLFLLFTQVIMPLVRSMAGKTAELVLPYLVG